MRTELLSAAQSLGCEVLDGGHMLVAQAADTFTLLTGVRATQTVCAAILPN